MEIRDILNHLLTNDYLGHIHKAKCLLDLLSNPQLVLEAKEILEKSSRSKV